MWEINPGGTGLPSDEMCYRWRNRSLRCFSPSIPVSLSGSIMPGARNCHGASYQGKRRKVATDVVPTADFEADQLGGFVCPHMEQELPDLSRSVCP